MKLVLFSLCALCVLGLNVQLDVSAPAVTMEMIDLINSNPHSTWTAGVNQRFFNRTISSVKRLCGVLPGPSPIKLPLYTHDVDLAAIPAAFDARTQWGSQCPSTNDIRDQADCGSCWAFGAVEAMTDRICIVSQGASQYYLAAEDVLSCCDSCGMGCAGGFPEAAWSYWDTIGVVTGGDWDSDEGCYPYAIAACDHHVKGKYPPCGQNEVPTPPCHKQCEQGYNGTWTADKHFGASAYAISSKVSQIQTEIMTNGPVEASFTVYLDFVSYKSGVYKHTSGGVLGGHAIKILGWGVLNGVNYWTVANSWNTDWGAQGYFLIERGVDECGIESGVVAGKPKM